MIKIGHTVTIHILFFICCFFNAQLSPFEIEVTDRTAPGVFNYLPIIDIDNRQTLMDVINRLKEVGQIPINTRVLLLYKGQRLDDDALVFDYPILAKNEHLELIVQAELQTPPALLQPLIFKDHINNLESIVTNVVEGKPPFAPLPENASSQEIIDTYWPLICELSGLFLRKDVITSNTSDINRFYLSGTSKSEYDQLCAKLNDLYNQVKKFLQDNPMIRFYISRHASVEVSHAIDKALSEPRDLNYRGNRQNDAKVYSLYEDLFGLTHIADRPLQKFNDYLSKQQSAKEERAFQGFTPLTQSSSQDESKWAQLVTKKQIGLISLAAVATFIVGLLKTERGKRWLAKRKLYKRKLSEKERAEIIEKLKELNTKRIDMTDQSYMQMKDDLMWGLSKEDHDLLEKEAITKPDKID